MTDAERIEYIARLAGDLLLALQPWQLQPPSVRSAATRLTVALAALPLPERIGTTTPKASPKDSDSLAGDTRDETHNETGKDLGGAHAPSESSKT